MQNVKFLERKRAVLWHDLLDFRWISILRFLRLLRFSEACQKAARFRNVVRECVHSW